MALPCSSIKTDTERLPFGLPGVNEQKKVSNGNYLWISYFFYTRSVPCELWFFDRGKSKVQRDHVLMVDARNNAVASVMKQEELKERFPVDKRLQYRIVTMEMPERTTEDSADYAKPDASLMRPVEVNDNATMSVGEALQRSPLK